jgi:hypothetical protein
MGDRPDRPGLRLAGLTWAVQSVRLSAALLLLGTLGSAITTRTSRLQQEHRPLLWLRLGHDHSNPQ